MAKKNSKRREWTKTDVRELKALAREKTPARKIARTLKRTEGATRQKALASEFHWIPVPRIAKQCLPVGIQPRFGGGLEAVEAVAGGDPKTRGPGIARRRGRGGLYSHFFHLKNK
jgi:hypothetical protein